MRLRTALIAAAVIFVVSAITLIAEIGNLDNPDPPLVYEAAWLGIYLSVLALIIIALVALVRYFAKRA